MGTLYEVGSPQRFFRRDLLKKTTGVQTYSKAGELSVTTGGPIFRFPSIVILTDVIITLGVAPVGASVIVDVHRNAATVFGATKPTIPAGGFVSDPVRIQTLILPSDNIQVEIDQVGTTTPGSFLTVELRYRTVR